MNSARLRGRVVWLLLSAAVSCGGWEEAQAQRGGTKRTAAATRRARRTAARRARTKASRRPTPATTTRDLPVVYGERDTDAAVGPASPPNNDGPAPGQSSKPGWRSVEGGVLTGKAISKPAPEYPAIAKAARASGTVTVQIIVDEEGRVIAASAVSGHPLLQQSAVAAVRQWRFTPTLLSGQPVKVTGVVTINYNLK